jgi:hypothetical protein
MRSSRIRVRRKRIPRRNFSCFGAVGEVFGIGLMENQPIQF